MTNDSSLTSTKRFETERAHKAMLKEIRTWAFWLIGIGAFSLVAPSFLSASWGVLLIAVGLASFLFKDAAMFVVYGVAVAWAAVGNAIGGIATQQWFWAIFSIVQAYMAVRVFMSYARFRRVQADWRMMSGDGGMAGHAQGRADRFFPPAGCALSALALLGVIAMVATIIAIFGVLTTQGVPPGFEFGVGLVVDLAVLGLGVSLASLLSRFRLKVLSILGLIASADVLGLFLIFSLPVG